MITCPKEQIARSLSAPDSGFAKSRAGGQRTPFGRQNHPCVSLELAALNELVAQLLEQRPLNPNLGKNPRALEATIFVAMH
jgi:hypothetical protein